MQLLQSHVENHPGQWRQAYQQQIRRDCWSPKQRITAAVCISCRDANKSWRVRKEAAATGCFCSKTMQVDGYWLHWTKTQLFFPDGWSNGTHHCLQHGFGASLVFCPSSSAGLQETLLLLRRIEKSNIKSGTAIRPENESYFWSLYQTVQSLLASSKLFWKLLNTRDEDSSVFLPQPYSRIALDMPLDSYLTFPLWSLWPETCTKSGARWMRYLILSSGTKLKQQQKLFLINESKISSEE